MNLKCRSLGNHSGSRTLGRAGIVRVSVGVSGVRAHGKVGYGRCEVRAGGGRVCIRIRIRIRRRIRIRIRIR